MSEQQQQCIWCGKFCTGSLEHILPEGLGCPPGFVLRTGVCVSCNNSLGHVDQALVHEFEIGAYVWGIPKKGGRPPAIDSWAPLAAAKGPDGPELFLNAGPGIIRALGKNLPVASAKNGIINVNFNAKDGVGTLSFDQPFGASPKFPRAIYKVALESIAYFHGLETIYTDVYDSVRDFVKNGLGNYRLLMLARQDEPRHFFGPHWTMPGSRYPIVGMTILGLTFIADFDPGQEGLAHIFSNAPAGERCVFLPPS